MLWPIWGGGCVCLLAFTLNTVAQTVVPPATPSRFKTRTVESTASYDGTMKPLPNPPATVRTVTYYTLLTARQWRSTDGKSLLGSLIAFEEAVVETKGAAPVSAPTPPAKPTIVRQGKARLLVNGRPVEVPLERLVAEDRELIESVRVAAPK